MLQTAGLGRGYRAVMEGLQKKWTPNAPTPLFEEVGEQERGVKAIPVMDLRKANGYGPNGWHSTSTIWNTQRNTVPMSTVWVGNISVVHDSKIYAHVGSGSNTRI